MSQKWTKNESKIDEKLVQKWMKDSNKLKIFCTAKVFFRNGPFLLYRNFDKRPLKNINLKMRRKCAVALFFEALQ